MLEDNQLKLSNGKHVAMDATLIQSSRRAKKVLQPLNPHKPMKLISLMMILFNIQTIKMPNGLLKQVNTPMDIHPL